MGLTYVDGNVSGPTGSSGPIRFLVDSGVKYTLLPSADWQQIGVTPQRTMAFVLADGTTIDRAVSECFIQLPQGESHTPVILGEPGDEPLLGVVTLEILGLVLNPFNRTLQPMRTMMA